MIWIRIPDPAQLWFGSGSGGREMIQIMLIRIFWSQKTIDSIEKLMLEFPTLVYCTVSPKSCFSMVALDWKYISTFSIINILLNIILVVSLFNKIIRLIIAITFPKQNKIKMKYYFVLFPLMTLTFFSSCLHYHLHLPIKQDLILCVK